MEQRLITPAEAALLLEPRGSTAAKCLQAGLLSLVDAGRLAFEASANPAKPVALVLIPTDPSQRDTLPAHIEALGRALIGNSRGTTLDPADVVRALQRAFGASYPATSMTRSHQPGQARPDRSHRWQMARPVPAHHLSPHAGGRSDGGAVRAADAPDRAIAGADRARSRGRDPPRPLRRSAVVLSPRRGARFRRAQAVGESQRRQRVCRYIAIAATTTIWSANGSISAILRWHRWPGCSIPSTRSAMSTTSSDGAARTAGWRRRGD